MKRTGRAVTKREDLNVKPRTGIQSWKQSLWQVSGIKGWPFFLMAFNGFIFSWDQHMVHGHINTINIKFYFAVLLSNVKFSSDKICYRSQIQLSSITLQILWMINLKNDTLGSGTPANFVRWKFDFLLSVAGTQLYFKVYTPLNISNMKLTLIFLVSVLY